MARRLTIRRMLKKHRSQLIDLLCKFDHCENIIEAYGQERLLPADAEQRKQSMRNDIDTINFLLEKLNERDIECQTEKV